MIAIVILNSYWFYTKLCFTKLLPVLRVVLLRHVLCVQCSCVSVMPICLNVMPTSVIHNTGKTNTRSMREC